MYSTESLEEELKALLSVAIEDKDKTKETTLFYIALFFLNTSLYICIIKWI